jgi:spoIIIJ-associated protein
MGELEANAAETAATDWDNYPDAGVAREVLTEICRLSGLDMTPVVSGRHDAYLEVELVGDGAAGTFGRNGRTLDALQYIVNLLIGRRGSGEVRVLLDADGYRERRAQVLCDLALEYAAQVKDRQEECELDPLPPHERRIIHKALAGEDGIRTYSEGDEPDRRVVIAPR